MSYRNCPVGSARAAMKFIYFFTAVQNKWDLDRGCRFEAGLKAKEAFEVGKVPSFFL
jgi:hypothetical protein